MPTHIQVALISLLAPAAFASAGDEARCRWLRAEARSTAATLMYPRLEAQVLRFPGTAADGTPVELGGQPLALRGFVAYSPVDLLRGRTLMSVAEADCERSIAQSRLERRVRRSESLGTISALRRQVAALEQAIPRAATLTREAERRLERQAATVHQVEELRRRSLRLQLELSEARGEIARLEALEPSEAASGPGGAGAHALREDLSQYRTASLALQSRRGAWRKLQAWQVDVRVGVEPLRQLEVVGMVTLGFNLGRLMQGSAEDEAWQAREVMLRESDSEISTQAARVARWLEGDVPELQRRLALLDEELAVLKKNEAALREQASDHRTHVLALAELNRLELEAQRAFLAQLLEERKTAGEGS